MTVVLKDLSKISSAGKCCQRFHLYGRTHAELLRMLGEVTAIPEAERSPADRDLFFWVPNLVPWPAEETGYPAFRCKLWNEETGKCMDYEHRPGTCRRYGLADKGCTATDCSLLVKDAEGKGVCGGHPGG